MSVTLPRPGRPSRTSTSVQYGTVLYCTVVCGAVHDEKNKKNREHKRTGVKNAKNDRVQQLRERLREIRYIRAR